MWQATLSHPAESKTTVLDDLTGVDENREGGSGEAERYCMLGSPTDLSVCVCVWWAGVGVGGG